MRPSARQLGRVGGRRRPRGPARRQRRAPRRRSRPASGRAPPAGRAAGRSPLTRGVCGQARSAGSSRSLLASVRDPGPSVPRGRDDRVTPRPVGRGAPAPRSLVLEGTGLGSGGTTLPGGTSRPGGPSAVAARPDPADRSRSGPRDDVRPARAVKAAPRGTAPRVACRRRAARSFRASATVAVRRTRPRPRPTRPRNRTPGAESGRWRSRGQASPTVAWRGRRSPAFGMPCPRPVPPLRRGLGAGPARAAGRRRSPERRNGAPSRSGGPGPVPTASGRAGAAAAAAGSPPDVAPTSASRPRSTGAVGEATRSPPTSRRIPASSRSGEGRPPPVPGASRRAGRSLRGGPWSAAPRPAGGPSIRSVCRARPSGGVPRPRVGRRRPSSPGPGGRTVGRTRRPPRARAVGVRASFPPSVVPVPARRCRRSAAVGAGSTTRLPVPSAPGGRRTREPSGPASRRTTTRTGRPARRSTVVPGRAGRSGGAPPAPPATACLEGSPPPGALAVTSRRASPSPSDAKGAASLARTATRGAVAG